MDIFQLVFILFQIAFGLMLLAIPVWILSRIARFMTKSGKKTYRSVRY